MQIIINNKIIALNLDGCTYRKWYSLMAVVKQEINREMECIVFNRKDRINNMYDIFNIS